MERTFYWVGISGMPGRPSIGLGKTTLARQLYGKLLTHPALDQRVEIIPMAYGLKTLASYEVAPVRVIHVYRQLRAWGHSHDRAAQATHAVTAAFRRWPTRKGQKNRRLLQYLGTEVGRAMLGEDTWVDLVDRTAQKLQAHIVLTDDIRYDNEARAVDLHVAIDGGLDLAALCKNHEDLGQPADYFQAGHCSEQSLTHQPDRVLAPRWSMDWVDMLADEIADSVVMR
jgi:hypothetical protein